MPVYRYECGVCGRQFELRRHFGDPHPTTCPDGHTGVHRVFVPPAIIFKGSGFYVTDHGRNGRVSQRSSYERESSEKQASKSEAKEGAKA